VSSKEAAAMCVVMFAIGKSNRMFSCGARCGALTHAHGPWTVAAANATTARHSLRD
jgi:hypothetical protein